MYKKSIVGEFLEHCWRDPESCYDSVSIHTSNLTTKEINRQSKNGFFANEMPLFRYWQVQFRGFFVDCFEMFFSLSPQTQTYRNWLILQSVAGPHHP